MPYKLILNRSGEHYYIQTITHESSSDPMTFKEVVSVLDGMDAVFGSNLSPASFVDTLEDQKSLEIEANEQKAKKYLGMGKEKLSASKIAGELRTLYPGQDISFQVVSSYITVLKGKVATHTETDLVLAALTEKTRVTPDQEEELDSLLAPSWLQVYDGEDLDWDLMKSLLASKEPLVGPYIERAKSNLKDYLVRMAEKSKIASDPKKNKVAEEMNAAQEGFAKFIRAANDEQLAVMRYAIKGKNSSLIDSTVKKVLGEKVSSEGFKDELVSEFFVNMVDTLKVSTDLVPENERQTQNPITKGDIRKYEEQKVPGAKSSESPANKEDSQTGPTSDELTTDDVQELENEGATPDQIDEAPTAELKEELSEEEKEYFPDDVVEAVLVHPDAFIKVELVMEVRPEEEEYKPDEKVYVARVISDPTGTFDINDIEYIPFSKIKRLIEGGADRLRKLTDPEVNMELNAVYASRINNKKIALAFLKEFSKDIEKGKLATESTDLPTLMKVFATRRGIELSSKRAFVSKGDNVRLISEEQMIQGEVESVDDKQVTVDLDSGGSTSYEKVIGPDMRWVGDVRDEQGNTLTMKKSSALLRSGPEVVFKTASGIVKFVPRQDGIVGFLNGERLGKRLACSLNRVLYNFKTSAIDTEKIDLEQYRHHWPLYEIPGLEGELRSNRIMTAEKNGYTFFVTKALPEVIWAESPYGRIEHYARFNARPINEDMLNSVVNDAFLQRNINSVFASEQFDKDFVKFKKSFDDKGASIPISEIKKKYASEKSKFIKGELVTFSIEGKRASGMAWEDKGDKIAIMTAKGPKDYPKEEVFRKSQVLSD